MSDPERNVPEPPADPSNLRRFAEVAEAVGSTTSKSEKVRLVATYLRSLSSDDASWACIFFTGRPFPRSQERILSVGGGLLGKAVQRIANPAEVRTHAVYLKHGD